MGISVTRRWWLGATIAVVAAPASLRAGRSSRGQAMQLRFTFDTHDFTATLGDTPTARDLMSMLPLDLTIEDYSTNEKIAHLPRRLTEDGSGTFSGEAPGDLCYFAPWGNLAFFYKGYRYSRGLIRLGRLDGGIGPLLTRGSFPLSVQGLP
ncbi:cyclophilin-like fold protein (plasmid) [Tistrella mobilis]|uniref:cyclophilin-like fold protein n=1 Tax=Tistrella mobilis TaxID=171437 RepID=UPI003557E880